MGYFKKSRPTNCDRMLNFANFKNGGTDIQIGILYVMLNTLSISLLLRVNDTSGYFGMQTDSKYHFRFLRKLINCRWPVRTFG